MGAGTRGVFCGVGATKEPDDDVSIGIGLSDDIAQDGEMLRLVREQRSSVV